MAEPFAYVVWFVPTQPVRDMLARIISELAQQFGTPAFTPHATLCSGSWQGTVDELKRKVDTLSSALQPSALTGEGIDCGDKRTTFFYLKLDNEKTAPLFGQAKRALPGSHSPEIGAHLSLMYAEPNAGIDRKALATEFADRFPAEIDFDEVHLLTSVDAEASVEHWQTQHVARLAPADR